MAAPGECSIARVWILDSGSSQHVTYRREGFTTFRPYTGEIKGVGGTTTLHVPPFFPAVPPLDQLLVLLQ